MPRPTVIEKEMGLTHGDFFRSIGNALGSHDFERREDGVTSEHDGKCLTITLGPQSERRIALLKLPVTQVTFVFEGYADDEIKTAIKRFDIVFKRGGG